MRLLIHEWIRSPALHKKHANICNNEEIGQITREPWSLQPNGLASSRGDISLHDEACVRRIVASVPEADGDKPDYLQS
ncbi:hypothetical protein T265_05993 [Opisthorchis viverrini]|uniref:Uncharacterized protein n=1 Tax=Opisthorchis viverrini TaxID=6198 RepID=A0A074ZHU8_OPIVI|nr:hypothetical protein T265_05993 [Opisthorchis viverrini]KER26863.1 hypothetical protein T265_05993 [Opisthorchis viverrini]